MAEYYMSYAEISDFVDECIEEAENNANLKKYRAEIMAALTLMAEDGNE